MDTNEEEFLCELYKKNRGKIDVVDMYPIGDKCALGKNITEKIVKKLEEKKKLVGKAICLKNNRGA